MSNNTFSTLSANFSGALETGVDPRTGQFFMNLPLANINANHLMGPGVSLSARYSTLSDSDSNGLGKGVSLGGVSFFNHLTRRLILSNGESWPIDTSNSIPDRRLKDCIFSVETTKSGGEQYILLWKNGVREHLSLIGGNIYATSHIYSPIGKEMQLSWSWNGTSVLLKEIKDQYCGLCRFEYNQGGMMITLWPQSVEECRFIFTLQNGRLSSVRRPLSGNEEMIWRMNYSLVGPSDKQIQLLTSLSSPTGMTDTVSYYKQEGLDFPEGSGLKWLPVVESHTKNYGGGQLPKTSSYRYSSNNFLGRNASTDIFGSWHSQSDYIYSILTKDYTYWSTETLSTENESVTVTRTYNNYHFLISEKTNRNGCETLTETEYYAEIGKPSKTQPPQYMLPKTRSVTFKENNNSRTEKTVTNFDEYGNPTYSETPDGTVTEYTYYSADGEGNDCPAEPNGFVRFLKEKVITPRPTSYKDTPSHTTNYIYSKLCKTNYVVQKTVSEYKDRLNRVLLTQRAITYQDDINTSEFGRITAITDTKYKNGENSEKFISRQDFTTSLNGGILNQEVTFTEYDGLKATSKRCQSVFSGQVYSETSAQGIETRYAYDKLGRLINRTVCLGSDYESTTTWEYGINSEGPYSIETDTFGNKNKTGFDGAGRAISEQRFDAETAKWYETFSCAHNSLGEISTGLVTDYLPAGNPNNYPMKANITYGGWGYEKEVAFSDGIKTLRQTDPIVLTQTVYCQGGTGNTALTSGNITTILDEKSQLPIKKTLQENIGGQPYSWSQYTWDGLGQLRDEKDELERVTKRTYDEYGRMLTQTLADGTIVSRTYAAHLTGNYVASISVTGPDTNGVSKTWALGTQTFDSFGRVTKRVSGGRTTLYSYNAASPVPSTVILPSGKTVEYTYIPELGNAVKSMKADGITQTFNYDKKTGQPLTADEASAKIQNTWSQAGQLKQETFLHNAQNRNAKHTYTLKGAPVSYTDVAGKQTQYNMDTHGRVTLIDDDSLTVNLTYDALGRLHSQTVRDKASTSSLTTAFNYDSFGREITRTVTDKRGITVILSQAWLKNGLLASRTTQKNGIKLREEQYGYDERNRLVSYTASGDSLPIDGYGHRMTAQTYRYDALNNLTSVKTTLADRSTNTVTYSYQNASDPTQLTTLTNTHDKYPKTINLSYDAEGRMTRDEAGRTLAYDVMGRLISVSDDKTHRSGTYSYDALNRLITRNAGNNDTKELYYRGAELVNEVNTSANKETRLIKTGHTCLGVSDDKGLTLTAGDKNDSLLWSEDAGTSSEGELHVWSPYGSGNPGDRLPGFNGERVDPVSGTYHLGNGYRAYNPVLMRFNCPDSLSPFGAGGINMYAYCAGDPINHTDPSGHLSWQAITGIVAGAIGLGLAVFTAGASIAAAGGVMAALSSASASSLIIGGLGVVADITAIASGSLEDSNPEASATLGWVSLATGLPGMAAGIVGVGRWGANKALGRIGSYDVAKASRLGMTRDAQSLFRPLDESVPRAKFNVDRPELSFQKKSFFNPPQRLPDGRKGYLLGPQEPWKVDFNAIKNNPNRNGFREMENAAKGKYSDFVKEVQRGNDPTQAAKNIGTGSKLEKLKDTNPPMHSIRLSKEHRAVFTINKPEKIISMRSVGSHYKNL